MDRKSNALGKLHNEAARADGAKASPEESIHAIGLDALVLSLIDDLRSFRRGEITVPDMRVRTQMAHEILRGVGLLIQGRRMLAERAKLVSKKP